MRGRDSFKGPRRCESVSINSSGRFSGECNNQKRVVIFCVFVSDFAGVINIRGCYKVGWAGLQWCGSSLCVSLWVVVAVCFSVFFQSERAEEGRGKGRGKGRGIRGAQEKNIPRKKPLQER